jgi:tRNA threonylcarbamoyladenosine biosynthesis protein TsaE
VVVKAAVVTLRTDGPDGTREAAAALARLCRVGDVVLLVGDLGAGKTTFAQGFGEALGVREPIVSPTFTLVRQYTVPAVTSAAVSAVAPQLSAVAPEQGERRLRQFIHADLYRLSDRREVADLGLGQLVEDGGVAVVEWGEGAQPVLGDDCLRVDLEHDADGADDGEETYRTIRVMAHGGTWPTRWGAIESALDPWRWRP